MNDDINVKDKHRKLRFGFCEYQLIEHLRYIKGLVKKYGGGGGGGGGEGGGPEHLKMWWLQNTRPTPSIWHKLSDPPLNGGWKSLDRPPYETWHFWLHNPTKSHFVYEIMVLFTFSVYFSLF